MQNLIEKLGLGERATSMVVWVGLSILLLVIVVALAVWLVRTLRSPLNIGGSHGRGGRPQRLAITDAFNLDRDGRKLVIVRRDNVEHLLLIGGPNDVLVESSIVRGERSLRASTGRGTAENELLATEAALTTEMPRPDTPVVPVPAPPPAAVAPTMALTPPPFRPAPPPPAAKPPQPAAPRLDDEFERAITAMQNIQRQEAAQPPRAPQPAPPSQPAPPAYVAPQPVFTPPPAPVAPPPPPPAPPIPAAPPAATPVPPARSEPVSEMARRLNEVLQKPLSGSLRPPFNKPIPPVPGTMNSAPKPAQPAPAPQPLPQPPLVELELPALPPLPAPPAEPPATPPPSPPVAKAQEAGLEMDLLEEEMARLLGRASPPKKPGEP